MSTVTSILVTSSSPDRAAVSTNSIEHSNNGIMLSVPENTLLLCPRENCEWLYISNKYIYPECEYIQMEPIALNDNFIKGHVYSHINIDTCTQCSCVYIM